MNIFTCTGLKCVVGYGVKHEVCRKLHYKDRRSRSARSTSFAAVRKSFSWRSDLLVAVDTASAPRWGVLGTSSQISSIVAPKHARDFVSRGFSIRFKQL
jgi:hypothetical protein